MMRPQTSPPRLQRLGGYLALAAALTYAGVKLTWIASSADGRATPPGWSVAGWVTLNAVTVAMAAVGGLFGLGIARGWRRLLPAPLLVTLVWLLAGFLVSLLPFMVASSVLEAAGVISADASPAPRGAESPIAAAEATLIGASFGGIAVGVMVGLPAYLVGRWPWLRSPGRAMPEPSSTPARRARLLAGAAAGVVGTWWLAWGAGVTVGADGHRLTGQSRLLEANLGGWALLSGLLLLGVRVTRRPWLTSVALFVGSGSMFAWGCWRLVAAVWHPPGYDAPAALPVLVSQYSAAVAASAIALHVVLGRIRDSGRTADTAHGSPGAAGDGCGIQYRTRTGALTGLRSRR